jgi:hypothetical protein
MKILKYLAIGAGIIAFGLFALNGFSFKKKQAYMKVGGETLPVE